MSILILMPESSILIIHLYILFELLMDSIICKVIQFHDIFQVYWYRVTATALKSLSKQCQYLQKLDLSWCGDFNHITSEDFVA